MRGEARQRSGSGRADPRLSEQGRQERFGVRCRCFAPTVLHTKEHANPEPFAACSERAGRAQIGGALTSIVQAFFPPVLHHSYPLLVTMVPSQQNSSIMNKERAVKKKE